MMLLQCHPCRSTDIMAASTSQTRVEGEREPLLAHREGRNIEQQDYQAVPTKLPDEGARVDPRELEDALSPEQRRKSLIRWLSFWLAFGTLTTVLVVLAIKKGDAKLDLKGALAKALGGGVSGAAAMVIQVMQAFACACDCSNER